jgi:predicted RNase H-like HicB family nuclease
MVYNIPMGKQTLAAIVWQEGKWFVAKLLDVELASQGRTRKEALRNLQEALDLLLEDEGVTLDKSLVYKNVELEKVYAQALYK